MLFNELWLKPWLLRSLDNAWYTEATPIQEMVLKIANDWENIVWQSQTGTGKTAAFLLPVLNKIDMNKKTLQALIIAPTRELVNQIWDEIINLTKYYSMTSVCLYGWASPVVQRAKLRKNPAIIVATPWRLMDFMNQKVVNVSTVESFILDEVDVMLDMWFVRDIKKIRAQLRNLKQTYTFSATMNNKMKEILKEHLPKYEFIKIGEKITVDKINHKHMRIDHEHKIYNLINLIKTHKKDKILVFTHTKRNTKTLHTILQSEWYSAWLLNWNLSQNKRQSTLNAFKEWKIKILVTTDVSARWLNMDNVWLVVNFDVPIDAKSYIHRIGRTWRAGASGKAIMMVSPLEWPLLKEIEKIHRTKVHQLEQNIVYDEKWIYKHFKLDRSTDKRWWRWGKWSKSSHRYWERKFWESRHKLRGKEKVQKNNSSKYWASKAKRSGNWSWSTPGNTRRFKGMWAKHR